MKGSKNKEFKSLIYVLLIVIFLGVSLFYLRPQKNEESSKEIKSLVNSYNGFIKEGSDEKLSDQQFEDLKYRYFSNNATNIASKTVYRAHDVHQDSFIIVGGVFIPSTETLKRTNFMEAFRDDSEMGDSRLVFSRSKDVVTVSSTFGGNDCYSFVKEMKKYKFNITINNKVIDNITNDDLRTVCRNDYNMISVKN